MNPVLCAALILAAILVFNLIFSIAAGLLWKGAERRAREMEAATRARLLFFLSVAPLAAALILSVGVILPAFILFEPENSGEYVGYKLGVAAVVSGAGIAVAALRVFGSWWTTRRLVSGWMSTAEEIQIEGINIPAYKIDSQFPVVAVVGAVNPRMFVAGQVLEALSPAELKAAARHELGHLVGRDNFKRALIRISRDLLVLPLAGNLEKLWNQASESAADEFAAREGGNAAALELASALVKISRQVPSGMSPQPMSAGSYLVIEEEGYISLRVRRLVDIADGTSAVANEAAVHADFVPLAIFSIAVLVFVIYADFQLLRIVHDLTEIFVGMVQ